MKRFIKNRVLPVVCTLSILISLCVVPASAATFPDAYRDTGSVDDINALIGGGFLSDGITLVSTILQITNNAKTVFWNYVDGHLNGKYGEVTIDTMNDYRVYCDSILNTTMGDNFFSHAQSMAPDLAANTMCYIFFGKVGLEFEIAEHPSSGLHRIYCPELDWWVTDSSGKYPYCISNIDTSGGNQWIGEVTALDRVSAGNFELEQSEGHLDAVCKQIRAAGTPAQIRSLGSNHKCIWYNRQVLCNDIGQPIVCWYNDEQAAANQDRPVTDITTEDGDIVLGDKAELDLENMIMYLPDGSINFIDNFTYDESTKSYHIDSHDTYNYTINNYYTWNYYINYTSITYIGQTEEYNKYYEVYYELPDGRDSADLTKEELEQLNLSIDVIPYGRSADDTSLRSLYHFDGDTRDASYWNYCTDFTWNNGASLTYMDAGVFDGALYLDEKDHCFTVTLPSNISSGDFTLQFRYYQSATLAPVTDSYISMGIHDNQLLSFDGKSLYGYGGGKLCEYSVGSWNEIAIVRDRRMLVYYLNGVCVGTVSNDNALPDWITFYFGSEQQTYKYFDELRILGFALTNAGEAYEPTAVPHDTNLTLVLPDESVPVADEYWSFSSSGENLLSYDCMSGYHQFNAVTREQSYYTDHIYPQISYNTNFTSVVPYNGFLRVNALTSTADSTGYKAGLNLCIYRSGTYYLDAGQYVLSLVHADGSISTFDFYNCTRKFSDYDWGQISLTTDNQNAWNIYIRPTSYVDIMYIELVAGTSTDLSAELITSVIPMTPDQLKTPTLAVRTDIDITSYQIGGVRPSIPIKGQVWALVENERIVSIQIYNGQAWESCDGRIWTGERWIPASSYNIITLQDMYDIVDATPDYEYIYTESGFWSWWQRSWNAFTEKLFALLGNGTSGGTSFNPETAPSVPDNEETGEKGYSIIELLVVLKDGTWSIIRGVVSTAYDGFSGLVSTVSNAGSFFDSYTEDSDDSLVFIPLGEGETIWD